MKKINRIKCMLAATVFFSAAPACAMTITADYSSLGTVYQDGGGVLSNTLGGTDVTDIFKSNVQTSLNYWQNAILLNSWNMTISFKLDNLSALSAAGISQLDSFDGNTRPLTTTIRVDSSATPFYIDPTPADNSEFTLADFTILSGTVNSGRFGAAVGTPANRRYDLLSLILHEMEHALGFDASNASNTRYTSVINGAGDILTVPTLVSGLGSPFDIPVIGTHIDGTANGGIFNNTSLALPGFNFGERALLSGVDIFAICTIEGCDASQLNTNPSAVLRSVDVSPSAVPEPDILLLMSVAGLGMIGMVRRRRQLRS
ncbi:PEP-CTERM sorting domain-containing protein [Candidatus Nitrotoga arctica]|uniref:PEP-CTERM sorting domain-containing protein n=1 Tax=Candidatus Nitrotoga arctica TaxID=453162 RepID=UPI001EFB2777|nr:PEP-CTERM sorting domain-containing protein [Candidatus Nitrotoga arctica]